MALCLLIGSVCVAPPALDSHFLFTQSAWSTCTPAADGIYGKSARGDESGSPLDLTTTKQERGYLWIGFSILSVFRFRWFQLEFMPHVSLCGQTQCVTSLLSELPDNGTKLHTEMSLLKCMWQPFVAQLVHFPLLLKTHGSPPCSTFIFPHAGWGVYSSSPPCHCLFCWVWTSNSRLSADDIWLRMWHPWLIHTRLMHRNCFFRYFSVWCIHLFCSVLCSIEIDVHVTVFCALLSCTGLCN